MVLFRFCHTNQALMLIDTLFEKYHKHILLFYQHSILIAREKSHKRRSLFFQFPIKGTLLLVLRRILFWFFLFLPLAACFCCFGQPFFSWLQSFFYFLFFLFANCLPNTPTQKHPKPQTERFAPFFRSEQLEQASHAILMTRHLKFNRANCIASI